MTSDNYRLCFVTKKLLLSYVFWFEYQNCNYTVNSQTISHYLVINAIIEILHDIVYPRSSLNSYGASFRQFVQIPTIHFRLSLFSQLIDEVWNEFFMFRFWLLKRVIYHFSTPVAHSCSHICI